MLFSLDFVEKNYPTFLFSTNRWHPIESLLKYEAIPTLLQLSKGIMGCSLIQYKSYFAHFHFLQSCT